MKKIILILSLLFIYISCDSQSFLNVNQIINNQSNTVNHFNKAITFDYNYTDDFQFPIQFRANEDFYYEQKIKFLSYGNGSILLTGVKDFRYKDNSEYFFLQTGIDATGQLYCILAGALGYNNYHINLNQWYILRVEYDGASTKQTRLYIDGVLNDTHPEVVGTADHDFIMQIGKYSFTALGLDGTVAYDYIDANGLRFDFNEIKDGYIIDSNSNWHRVISNRTDINSMLSKVDSEIVSTSNSLPPLAIDTINIAYAGQSNCVSRTDNVDFDKYYELPYTGEIRNAFYWSSALSAFYPYTLNINSYNDHIGDYDISYKVTKDLLFNNKYRVVNTLKYAEGGTAIGTAGGYGKWAVPNGERLQGLVNELNASGLTYHYLIWNQWETDSINTTDSANYYTNLTALVNYIFANTTVQNIIIIKAYPLPSFNAYGNISTIQTAQTQVISENPNVFGLNPDTTMTDSDGSHYDEYSQYYWAEQVYNFIISN